MVVLVFSPQEMLDTYTKAAPVVALTAPPVEAMTLIVLEDPNESIPLIVQTTENEFVEKIELNQAATQSGDGDVGCVRYFTQVFVNAKFVVCNDKKSAEAKTTSAMATELGAVTNRNVSRASTNP